MTAKINTLMKPVRVLTAIFALIAFVLPAGIAAAFTGAGAGTVGNPYQITTCVQLQEMNDEKDAHYILMNDIDCSDTVNWNAGEGFVPVGSTTVPFPTDTFTGTLDGQNHVITGLYINRANNAQGLFGSIYQPAEVRNVGLVDVDISAPGRFDIGALVGNSGGGGLIDNCFAVGTVAGADWVGGLVGQHYGFSLPVTIQDSYAEVNVTASGSQAGGLVGAHTGTANAMIIRSYATGDVVANDRVGGLVGSGGGIISDSYATGNVTGTDQVGGLIGRTGGTITNSYATGLVTGDTNAGGLIGLVDVGGNGPKIFTNNFWDTETTGQVTSGAGEGKTTAEMKDILTFSAATWDIESSEIDLNNGYPFLAWQAGASSPVWYIYQALADSETNTATLISPLTGKLVVLEVDPACDIQSASVSAESGNTTADSGFDYPVGLMNFTLDCGTPGYTTTVTQYYYGLTNDNFVLRKHNPNTNAYFTIAGSTLEQTTHNGQAALKVTYQATDGGELDTDGAVNGIIVDPVGLAQGVVGAPNTGLGGMKL